MKITRSASSKTNIGPPESFAGKVYIDNIRSPDKQSKAGAANVRFAPGAHTAWHTHPHGQTIFVTEGVGLCQRQGGDVEVIRPGDVVYFEPGENHWHGAVKDRFMAHIAMQEADDNGNFIVWGKHLTDEEYAQQPSA